MAFFLTLQCCWQSLSGLPWKLQFEQMKSNRLTLHQYHDHHFHRTWDGHELQLLYQQPIHMHTHEKTEDVWWKVARLLPKNVLYFDESLLYRQNLLEHMPCLAPHLFQENRCHQNYWREQTLVFKGFCTYTRISFANLNSSLISRNDKIIQTMLHKLEVT